MKDYAFLLPNPFSTPFYYSSWYGGNSGGTLHEVGQKKPNAFGLYDMSGNVFQWCSDCYILVNDTYYIIPLAERFGQKPIYLFRVTRGGSWYGNSGIDCCSAYRLPILPDYSHCTRGFRLAMTP